MDPARTGCRNVSGIAGKLLYILLLSWIANAGTAFLTLSPLLVGGMVEHLHVSNAQAGLLASVHLAGVGIAAYLSISLSAALGQRRLAVLAIGCFALGELLFVSTDSLVAMFPGRFFAGFGNGVLFALAVANVALMNRKDSIFAFLLLCQMIFGFVGAWFWPQVLALVGFRTAMLGLPALALVVLPFARYLPAHQLVGTRRIKGRFGLSLVAVLMLVSLFLHYIANSAEWIYLERIGVEGGLSVEEASGGLAVSMIWGMVGTLLAMALGHLRSRFPQLAIGILGIMAGTGLLLIPLDLPTFTFASSLILLTMVFTIPFYQGFIADLENGEKLSMLAAGIISAGLALGPLLGAPVVGIWGYEILIWGCILGFTLALLLVLTAFRLQPPRVSTA